MIESNNSIFRIQLLYIWCQLNDNWRAFGVTSLDILGWIQCSLVNFYTWCQNCFTERLFFFNNKCCRRLACNLSDNTVTSKNKNSRQITWWFVSELTNCGQVHGAWAREWRNLHDYLSPTACQDKSCQNIAASQMTVMNEAVNENTAICINPLNK